MTGGELKIPLTLAIIKRRSSRLSQRSNDPME